MCGPPPPITPTPKPLGLASRTLITACLNCYFKWRLEKISALSAFKKCELTVILILILFCHIHQSVASVVCYPFFFLNYFLAIFATKSVVNLSYTNNETDFCIVLFFTENDTRTLS